MGELKATRNHDSRGVPGCISLKNGEIVVEIEPPKDFWVKVKNNRNQEGLVPLDSLGDPNKATATHWEAIKKFDSRGYPGCISLKIGEIVVEVEPPKDGYVKVKNYRDVEGLVPLNSLRDTNEAKATQWKARKNHNSHGYPNCINLKIGEIVVEIEPLENGYMKVKNDKNEEGMVPVDALEKNIQWRAVNDYDPKGIEGLIQVKEGELLDEVEPMKEDYVRLRNKDGAEGWVHESFLEKQ